MGKITKKDLSAYIKQNKLNNVTLAEYVRYTAENNVLKADDEIIKLANRLADAVERYQDEEDFEDTLFVKGESAILCGWYPSDGETEEDGYVMAEDGDYVAYIAIRANELAWNAFEFCGIAYSSNYSSNKGECWDEGVYIKSSAYTTNKYIADAIYLWLELSQLEDAIEEGEYTYNE